MNFRSKLLSQSQIKKCTHLASMDDQSGKRAKALLALHNGSTLKEASDLSGLTHGQVRYILERFRKMGIDSLAFKTVSKQVTTTKTTLVDDKQNEKEKSPKIRTKARSKKKKKKKVKEEKPRKSKKRKQKDKEKRKEKLKIRIRKEKEKKKKDKKIKRKKKK